MPVSIELAKDQSNSALWRVRLGSALRTALACTIVGCATLYGPAPLRRLLSYPAFSYVTTILIVSEATLGDAIRGFWLVAYATVQVAVPSVLTLWVIGPTRVTRELAAVAVALSTFLVALPESTPLLCKRIAFGQIVIVYVGSVVHGEQTGVFMHPIHVAASTAVAALASLLAMVFPFPRLACCEVRNGCRFYAENASKRLSLIVEAISAQDSTAARELLSQEKCLSKAGAKLLKSVKDNLGGMAWERPQIKFPKHKWKDLGEKLQDMEIPIKGMEIAVSFCSMFPISMIDEDFKQVLEVSKAQIGLKLEHAKCFVPFDATTAPEGKIEISDKNLWTPIPTSIIPENHTALFLLYCMEFLQDDRPTISNLDNSPTLNSDRSNEKLNGFQRALTSLIIITPCSHNFVFAFKCSISLGLAVLFGLIYNKENGYWSGLTIAISFVTGRQATFAVANARAQGTAMGSIYGILCLFLFQRLMDLRFLTLLPWIIFTSFLIHSKTYGQAGAFSAAIGALLIVGRRDYGPPTEFAIARIAEATIGLICFILVELLLNHARAATLARTELLQSVGVLRECFENVRLFPQHKNGSASRGLKENHLRLTYHVNDLQKFIEEAEMEPNFWFSPFNGASYHKLLGSFLTLVNLLHFVAYEIEFVSEASQKQRGDLEELLKLANEDLHVFNKRVGYALLRCLEEAPSTATLQELQTENSSHDIELERSAHEDAFKDMGKDDTEIESILCCFLRHSKEVVNKVYMCEGTEKFKRQMTLSLTGLGFCIHGLAREAKEIQKEVKELVKLEDPSK